MTTGLSALLYVSRLADGLDARAIGPVLAVARSNNAVYGETGVLVFDGEWFCQYVEGDSAHVHALRRKLLADQRHQEMCILAEQATPVRAFQNFRMGYVSVDDVGILQGLKSLRGNESVLRFEKMVASFDIQP